MNWDRFANPVASGCRPDWCKAEYTYVGQRAVMIGTRRQAHAARRWGYYNVAVVRFLDAENRILREEVLPLGRWNTVARATGRFLALGADRYVLCEGRSSNPGSGHRPVEDEDEADLSWLLRPVNETGMGLGYEHEVTSLRRRRFPVRTRGFEVRLYRDPYGSHRFVAFVGGNPIAALQVVKVEGRNGFVANVYTAPQYRGRGIAPSLLTVARGTLGEVRHGEHLTAAGARFAMRHP